MRETSLETQLTELRQIIASLQAEVLQQREEITRLKAHYEPPKPTKLSPTTSRRNLLKKLGLAMLTVGSAATVFGSPQEAQARVITSNNKFGAIILPQGSSFLDNTFGATICGLVVTSENQIEFKFGPFGRVGVYSKGDGYGVYALANTASGTGIFAGGKIGVAGAGSSYGVTATGNLAQLRLVPVTFGVPGAPTTGTHETGELFADTNGALYYCRVGGTPGTWVTLAA